MSRRVAPPLPGHSVRLLQGSAQLFPALIEALDAARTEVLLETYIFDFTGSGGEVALALQRAAGRGARVRVLVDGVGTDPLAAHWKLRFDESGVEWRTYSPTGRLGLLWPGQWRRLHRKLCVVDESLLFCGGINVLDDYHDPNHGALKAPRLDFSVAVQGPLVGQARHAMLRLWLRLAAIDGLRRARWASAVEALRLSRDTPVRPEGATGGLRASLVLRDNLLQRTLIERAYRRAIGQAREEIIIANAYFLPGRKIRSALIQAAGRGVRVCLLVHGRYEYFMQYWGARAVFGELLAAGVEMHEYAPSFLHAKVAVIDGRWATVGSSNLDPLSLLLAWEANVVVVDPGFGALLRSRLLKVIETEGERLDPGDYARRSWGARLLERLALLVARIGLMLQGKKYL